MLTPSLSQDLLHRLFSLLLRMYVHCTLYISKRNSEINENDVVNSGTFYDLMLVCGDVTVVPGMRHLTCHVSSRHRVIASPLFFLLLNQRLCAKLQKYQRFCENRPSDFKCKNRCFKQISKLILYTLIWFCAN